MQYGCSMYQCVAAVLVGAYVTAADPTIFSSVLCARYRLLARGRAGLLRLGGGTPGTNETWERSTGGLGRGGRGVGGGGDGGGGKGAIKGHGKAGMA